MAAAARPKGVTLRSYQVGFGDCFLLTFHYGGAKKPSDRHVLIDFGSTGSPKKRAGDWLMKVAEDIREVTAGKLHAVVATHRHADHISGFAGATGKVIEGLKPEVVIQPWTEDPKAKPDARSSTIDVADATKRFVGSLGVMQNVARVACREFGVRSAHVPRTVSHQLSFLGQTNLANLDAVKTLMRVGRRHAYVSYRSRSGLEQLLPGVKIHVLGPPNLKQTGTIRKQRQRDEDEFWHFQALATLQSFERRARVLGRHARKGRRGSLPFETRWFLPRLENLHADQVLEIVRLLDKALNNTSVILLFEVGRKKLLFPGDAQIENWQYALEHAPDAERNLKLLSDTALYKVGHHGSLNATPKTLWNTFRRRGPADRPGRLLSAMSTMSGKHGDADRETEVPRRKLVEALDKHSTLYDTQDLKGADGLCHVIRL